MAKRTKKEKPLALDLFSGCGGLSQGLKQAGFAVIGAVEIDPLAVETYRKNHPEVQVWAEDVRNLTGRQIMRKLHLKKGDVDLLAGCPPCQGFSVIRTRNGRQRIRDSRNDLILDYVRLVKALLPKTIMMENVPALIKDRRMSVLKAELEAFGYDFNGSPLILDTADYHVPQRRRRLILVASRVGRVDLPAGRAEHSTVRDAIGNMPRPGRSGDPLHDIKENRSTRVRMIIKKIPKNGGSRSDLPNRLHLRCHQESDGFRDVYGRMSWGDVSPTITGGCINPSKGRFLHPSQNRAITLREAALLQSFPMRYYFSLRRGKCAVGAMIGNALPPAFIKRHALAIKRRLDIARS